MLTHNAPHFIKKSIISVDKYTHDCDYELIVVDNDSKNRTKRMLTKLLEKGYIDKLLLNSKNDLFAKENNLAASLANSNSDYYLLLNSDIQVNSSDWLSNLLKVAQNKDGIVSYGAVLSEPKRADGYCLLIDANLYNKYKLDEQFAWWWGVTKLEGEVLKEGKNVTAIKEHEKYLHHFGGKSGKGFKNAFGMNVDMNEVKSWFENNKVKII